MATGTTIRPNRSRRWSNCAAESWRVIRPSSRATSSAIPTSRPSARSIRAGAFPGSDWRSRGSACGPKAGTRPLDGDFHKALQRFGYAAPLAVPPKEIVKAFQRHFRADRVDGMIDPETRSQLAGLLDPLGRQPSQARVRRLDGCTRAGNRAGEESPGSTETRCRITSGGGDPRESATENRPPAWLARTARVKRWGKSPPREPATEAARQTPPGARPNRGDTRVTGSGVSASSPGSVRARRSVTGVPEEWAIHRFRARTEPGLQAV